MPNLEEYKKIYVQESSELLKQMNDGLLALEKSSSDKEALNAIFRSAHTLKSMSASMGFKDSAELAHKMEDVLSQIRDGKVNLTSDIVEVLFKSFDTLESMVDADCEGRKGGIDPGMLIEKLSGIVANETSFVEEKITEDVSLNKFERSSLVKARTEGFACYRVKITLEKGCALKSVRAFMVFRNLHSIGEVIKSMPDSRFIEEEKFEREFACLFVTKETEKEVEKKAMDVLEVENVEVKQFDLTALKAPEETEMLDEFRESDGAASSPQMRKIQSVRVDIARLDKLMNLTEELAINKLKMGEISMRMADPDLRASVDAYARLTDELQNEVMQARLVPVGQIFERFPRIVRDLAKKEGKGIKFDVIGADIELDRTVLDEIADPLIHILKNAVDHGIESVEERKRSGKPLDGRVTLFARREKGHVYIEVEDDGGGMDPKKIAEAAIKKGIVTEDELKNMKTQDILMLTAKAGFSTKEIVTDVSGRGVGLDVASECAERLGGKLLIETKLSRGTKIALRLPITTAVVQALLVSSAGDVFAIPISSVIEIISIDSSSIKEVEHAETLIHREAILPLVRMSKVLPQTADRGPKTTDQEQKAKLNVVIVEAGKNRFGIIVDAVQAQHDIVIKQLSKELKGIRGIAGATILGDGRVALVLDVETLI